MSTCDAPQSRRRFLGTISALGGAGLLGCSDGGEAIGPGGASGNGTSTGGAGASGPSGGTGGSGAGGGAGGSGNPPPVELGEIQLTSWRDSQQPLTWIYPRPDSESQPHWRHRRAPAGIPWTIPLGVAGGGYPYNFEVVSGPPGLVISGVGFDTGRPPFYYFLSLMEPAVGSWPVSLRVTDQNGATATRDFTLEVLAADDTSAFLFFDSEVGDNANPGSPASPKHDIGGWYLDDEDDSTFQGRQCFYQGTFDIGGVAGVQYDSLRVNFNEGKPNTHVGYGRGATWRGNGTYIGLGGGTGFYVGDLTYEDPAVGSGNSARNQHFLTANSSFANGAVFRVVFRGADVEPADGSNSSCIMLADPEGTTVYHSYFCFVGCVAEGVHHQSLLKNYRGFDGVFEGWTVRNCTNVTIVHQKGGTIRRWVTRGILAIEGNTLLRLQKDEWINDPEDRQDLEICWCSSIADELGRHVTGGGWTTDDFARHDSYRNNWRASHHVLSDVTTGVFTFEDDVFQHSGAYPEGIQETGDDFAATTEVVDCVVQTSNLLDPVTNLRIGGPDGEHGCEMVFVGG